MKDNELQELLDILQKVEAEAHVEKSGCSFKRFVAELGIRSGTDRVPNYLIYTLYCQKYKDVYGRNHFFRLMNSQFKAVRTGRQRSYMLDGSTLDLSKEAKLKAKHYDREKRQEKQQKKCKKTPLPRKELKLET